MKYIVFITTNLKTNQIYVGLHPTKNPEVFDGYLGNGIYVDQANTFKYPKTPLQFAVKKYGVSTFKRFTLFVCDTLEEAFAKKAMFGNDFINQPNVYNTQSTITKPSTLYQFNSDKELVTTWKYEEEAADFYGYPVERLVYVAKNHIPFLGYYWSYTKDFEVSNQPLRVYYIYNEDGKLLKECYSVTDTDALKYQTLVNGHYISNKMMDVFIPKARVTYAKRMYYVYTKDGVLKGKYKGKEVMRVLDNYSWKSIKNAIEVNKGWYKDFYISLEKVDQVPERTPKPQIDVYDRHGNFIETLPTLKDIKEKYGLTSAQVKRIQLGEKWINNWIFKYHTSK